MEKGREWQGLASKHLCLIVLLGLVLIHSFMIGSVNGQGNQGSTFAPCPPGRFGSNCTGQCHCLNGVNECGIDPATGAGFCSDFICDRGWKGTPFCQIPCSPGEFGPGCENACHCYEEAPCDIINGLCPGFRCHPDWTGASCQTRKPRLISPPTTSEVECRRLRITWPQWNEEVDFGMVPISSYTIQYRLNDTQWIDDVDVPFVHDETEYQKRFTFLDPFTTYNFRIVVIWKDNGKKQIGIPGPPSTGVVPACPVPTTSTTTTEPTTTTKSTTITTTTTATTTTTTVTTTPSPIPPPPIPELSITVTEGGRIILGWSTPTGPEGQPLDPNYNAPETYNITYQKIGIGNCNLQLNERPRTVLVPATLTGYSLDGIDGYSRYQLYVSGINRAGQGQAMVRIFATKHVAPSGQIQSLEITETGSTYVILKWDEVPCAQRGSNSGFYNIYISDVNRGIRAKVVRAENSGARVTGLEPFTQYSASVSFNNEIGQTTLSDEEAFTTTESPPSAPRNVKVPGFSSTSITLTWEPPVEANGVLSGFKISYTSAQNPDLVKSIVSNDVVNLRKVITDLDPYTDYIIMVQAKSQTVENEGWGSYSEMVTQRTDEGQPGPPLDLHRTSRNETCISMQWASPSQINGVLQSYKVAYDVLAESTDASTNAGTEIAATQLQFSACDLVPAVQYRFRVSASTSKSFGEPAILEAWTSVGKPPAPPKPVIKNITATHITIVLQPVVPTTGPVSNYYIIVADFVEVKRRKKRAYDPVKDLKIDGGYTAAMFDRTEITKARQFIVGDNLTYGGFLNKQLKRDSEYDLYFVVESTLDGITKLNHVQLEFSTNLRVVTLRPTTTTTTTTTTPMPTTITTTELITTTEAGQTDQTTLILAILIPLIILIIIIIILLIIYFCCRRCWQKSSEDDDMKTWLEYYVDNHSNSLQKTKWSDIKELNESRHVTVNESRSYMPDDIKVADIQRSKPSISFEEEYSKLAKGKQHPWHVATRPENVEKNRFEDFLAYDHSRVVLKKRRGDSGYINASYIQGYHTRQVYIAAQSPFDDTTIEDFWYMIYQEKVSQIVFLCRLVEDGTIKCEQYWPDQGLAQFGSVAVQHVKTEEYANFVIRTFDVNGSGAGHAIRVNQFQFVGWPDHGIPSDPIPFLDFRMKVKISVTNEDVPMVVHCGTGVSRTAVFIAVDCLMEQAKLENSVNVFRFTERMRRDRPVMVRTLKQYIFVYDVLFEALITIHNIVGDDLRVSYRLLSAINPITDKSHFREQFEVLEEFVPQLPENLCSAAFAELNKKKNRFQTIAPLDKHRVVLKNAESPDRGDYVNATYIDSYTENDAFIMTQTPMRNTVADFWAMIYEKNLNTIVMMNNAEFKEESCVQYWPPRMGVEKYDPFVVGLKHEKEEEYFTIRTLELHSIRNPTLSKRKVRQFQFKCWPMYEKVPWQREGFLQLMEKVDMWREKSNSMDKPVVIHCMDGASQSGLYCASFVLCEKMVHDGEVNVFHTIKHIKRRRPHIINSLEQYKFCFKLLWDFLNTRIRRLPKRPDSGGYDNPTFTPEIDDMPNGDVAL